MKLYDGSALFLNFWIWPVLASSFAYGMTAFPGREDNISGSTICTFNLGIGNNISNEHKEAAIEAFKFMTSVEMQKKYLKNYLINTAMFSLYDDEEICANVNCKLYKSLQPISRPGSLTDNYDEYSAKFRGYIFEYLYENETLSGDSKTTASAVLHKIDDLTKIYKLSFNLNESFTGFIFSLIIIFIAVIMFVSLAFLFIENYNPFFEFITFDYWIVNVFGTILILCSCLLYFGDLTVIKCQFHSIFISMGIFLNFVPIIHRLIVNFPESNDISNWTYKHGYLFSFLCISVEIIIDGLSFLEPYSVKTVNANYINGGKNYQYCKMDSSLGKSFIWLMVFYKFIIFMILLLLIFIEWNIKSTFYDIKFITSAIYVDILSVILLIIFNYVEINSYTTYLFIHFCIIIIISLSNYFFIYGFRYIFGSLRKRNNKLDFINEVNQGFIDNISRSSESHPVSTANNEEVINKTIENPDIHTFASASSAVTNITRGKRTSIFSKIVDYHFSDSSISYKSSEFLIYTPSAVNTFTATTNNN